MNECSGHKKGRFLSRHGSPTVVLLLRPTQLQLSYILPMGAQMTRIDFAPFGTKTLLDSTLDAHKRRLLPLVKTYYLYLIYVQ